MAHVTATSSTRTEPPQDTAHHLSLRVGSWVALTLTGVTILTFALALLAVPNDTPYPFTNDVIADQWPRDYLWMYPAMLLMLLFIALVAAVHDYAPATRRIFSSFALCLATLAATVLLITYFIQVTVLQPSLEKGQLDGWSMLTMYNPNGVFIALEELGYLLKSLALAVLAPVFIRSNQVERAIRWLFLLCFAAAVGALVTVSTTRGIDRGDLFEIIVISIVWLTLIIASPLVAIVLRRGVDQSPTASLRAKDRN